MDRLTPVDRLDDLPVVLDHPAGGGPRELRVDPDFLGPDDDVHPDDDEQVYEDPRPPGPGR